MDEAQFEALRSAIEGVGAPGWVAWLGLVAAGLSMGATAVLAVCAVAALTYAKGQLQQIVAANKDAATTERARFLFNVDEMFENSHFAASRAAFAAEMESIESEIRAQAKDASLEDQKRFMKEKFSKLLFDLMENNTRKYTRLMKLCGFFETLEVLIKNGFVEERHVIDLYHPAIVRVSEACTSHIIKRREMDPVRDRALYENFLALAKRAGSTDVK